MFPPIPSLFFLNFTKAGNKDSKIRGMKLETWPDFSSLYVN